VSAAPVFGEEFFDVPVDAYDAPAVPVEIMVTTDEEKIADSAIEVIARRENLFQRGGKLVHVVEDVSKGVRGKQPPRIVELPIPRLREMLANDVAWMRMRNGSKVKAHLPGWVVQAIASRGAWDHIRPLEAVVTSPIVKPSGELLTVPGYDDETGIWFWPIGKVPELPELPSIHDAKRACDELLDAVCDFPFESEIHRSTWLAALLTPLARFSFEGPAPLFLFDANTRGAGKSMLTDTIATIVSGRPMARMTQATGNPDEERKRITSLAMEGASLVLVDNVSSTLGNEHLDAVLTGTEWRDRVLGRTEMISMPMHATWYATGNNVMLAADTSRRVVHARLVTPDEKPEEREGFKHPELIDWVKQNRTRLLGAALTILRAYFVAGCPTQKIKPWGSFSGWTKVVRGALAWVGQPDCGETRRALQESSDTEAAALSELLRGWSEVAPKGKGLAVSTLLLELETNPARYMTIRGALTELCPPQGGKFNARSVGAKFKHFRERVIGDMCLVNRGDTKLGAVWAVVKASQRRAEENAEND